MKLHIMKHAEEKQFSCNYCGKKFHKNSRLARHKLTPFQCNDCGKRFNRKHILDGHKL